MMFFTLINKICPLYLVVIQGFLARKFFKVEPNAFNYIIFYFIMPVVFFDVGLNSDLTIENLVIPIGVFSIATLTCTLYYFFAKRIWNDGKENLIAVSAGSANAGYFGLFIASLLFNREAVNIFILGAIGFVFYSSSVSLYMITKSVSTSKDALIRVFKNRFYMHLF